MSINIILLLCFYELFVTVGCQCSSRSFYKHYLDPSSSVVLKEFHSRSRRECSVYCARMVTCEGYSYSNSRQCVMFSGINPELAGSTPVWVEGKK